MLNHLNNLKWKFARFMYGRYGVDQLYIAGGMLFVVLQLLQIFLKSSILNLILIIFMSWLVYRVFSKNIAARQAENRKFLELSWKVKARWSKVQPKWNLFVRRIQDIKTHRYRKCPECDTTLRLPRKRGTHKARCPKCRHLFEVKIVI